MEDPKITKMEFPDEQGGLTIAARHPAFAALALECMKLFQGEGAVNYCEWTMQGDPAFGKFTISMQRKEGKTPAEIAGGFRKKNEELLRLIADFDVDHHLLRGGKERLEGHETCDLCARIEQAYGMAEGK